MIKGLFFTAALLMPSLAYAGNPSANLSVQVVPAGVQVAPAGAQAAGYTTLAFHSDFTQPFYTNLSNWLDCAGATSPQWWIAGGNGHSPPPCAQPTSRQVASAKLGASGLAAGPQLVVPPGHTHAPD